MNNNLKMYNFIDFKNIKNNLINKNFCLLQINNLKAKDSQELYSALRENNINIKKIKLNLIHNRLISTNLNKYFKSNTYLITFDNNLIYLVKFLKKNKNILFPLNFFIAKQNINYLVLKNKFKKLNLFNFKKDSDCKNKIMFSIIFKTRNLLINFIYYLKYFFSNNIKIYANFKSADKKKV